MIKNKIWKEIKEFKKTLKKIRKGKKRNNFRKYTFNVLLDHYLKRTKSTKIAYPLDILIELTNHCNIACTTCPREHAYGHEMNKGMMKKGLPKKIIDEVHPYVDSIMLTGLGETFMYKELATVVDYIKLKDEHIKILISTNAVLPNFMERVAYFIGKIDSIQISIDGLGEVYDAIRLKSDFNLLDKNVKLLAKLCENSTTELVFNMVVTEENYIQMPLLVDYADEVGIDVMVFTTFNLASVTNISKSYYELYQSEDFLKVVAELDDKSENTKNVRVFKTNFKTTNSFQACPYPWSHLIINYDGYVPPCCAKPFSKEKNFGNVNNNKVIDIFNSEDFRSWRKAWFKNETPKFCDKCHFVDLEVKEKQL